MTRVERLTDEAARSQAVVPKDFTIERYKMELGHIQ